jgi:hypothetical protein
MLVLQAIRESILAGTPLHVHRLRKSLQTIPSDKWVAENRWLSEQANDVRVSVVCELHAVGATLSCIDTGLLTEVMYVHITTTNDVTELEHLVVPMRVLVLLVTRLFETDAACGLCKKTIGMALSNVIRLLDAPPSHRGYLVHFYESIYALALKLSSAAATVAAGAGSAAFRTLSESLATFPALLRKSSLTGYRVCASKQMHRTILLNVFKSLCVCRRFEDIDVLFRHHPVPLRCPVQKWSVGLPAADAEEVWSRCKTIRTYYTTHALKLKPMLQRSSVLWSKCVAELNRLNPMLLQLATQFPAPPCATDTNKTPAVWESWESLKAWKALCACANHDVATFFAILQQFPRVTQRAIIDGIVSHAADTDTDADTDADADDRFVQRVMLKHLKYVLTVTCNHPSVLRYYRSRGCEPAHLLGCLLRVTYLADNRLAHWQDYYKGIPLEFVTRFVRKNALYLKVCAKHTTGFDERTMRLLHESDLTFGKILRLPLCEVDDYHTTLAAMIQLAHAFKPCLSVYRLPAFRRMAQCVLMLHYMNTIAQPIGTVSEPKEPQVHETASEDCCAICYNSLTTPLKRLSCGHVFHTECMLQMTQHAPSGDASLPCTCVGKCPYCRVEIMPYASDVVEYLDAMHVVAPHVGAAGGVGVGVGAATV